MRRREADTVKALPALRTKHQLIESQLPAFGDDALEARGV
jgi:hypothetical protein